MMLVRYQPTLGILLMITMLVGCQSKEPKRIGVEGTVVLDGTPVPRCRIVFASLENDSRNASSVVIDGKFQIPEDQGPSEGKYAILFENIQPDLEEYEASKSNEESPWFAKCIPDRYCHWNELEATVDEHGPHHFSFQLKHP